MLLLSPFGFSPTGEAFNLTMEDVATSTAIALQADKLLFVTGKGGGDRYTAQRQMRKKEGVDEQGKPKVLYKGQAVYVEASGAR